MADPLYDDFVADEGDECSSCGKPIPAGTLMFGRPWGRISYRYYCSRACAADNFRSKGQLFADRWLASKPGRLDGLRGTDDDDEERGKLLDIRSRIPKRGMERIEQVFQEMEHLQKHNDPDCPDCKRIRKGTITLRMIRFRRIVLVSGVTIITGERKKPYDKNAWVYSVIVSRDGVIRRIGRFDTEANPHDVKDRYAISWWHNEGPGYDEGGNNRAAYLLDYLVRTGDIGYDDHAGSGRIPTFRVAEHVEIEDDRDDGPPSPRGA